MGKFFFALPFISPESPPFPLSPFPSPPPSSSPSLLFSPLPLPSSSLSLQLLKVHQSLQKEQDALKMSSAGAEKQLQRKISELQEVRELDLQAKTHMEESFRLMAEEKEEKISVLQTQVRLG